MEYSLDFFTYWKYHVLVLYYWLGEFPPIIRFMAMFILVNFFFAIITIVSDFIISGRDSREDRRSKRYRQRFYDGMREIALSQKDYSQSEIVNYLGLSPRIRVRVKKWQSYVPVFRELFLDVKGKGFNKTNWRNLMNAFKMPTYFEMQVRSPKMKDRMNALKDVADISCDLKEATATRYLYAKDDALRITARLHTARFGVSYPFRVFAEDAHREFTDEMCVKLHWVIKVRHDLGLSIPNFVRWCTLPDAHNSFRLFAVNEIRLFGLKSDCPELLNILKTCKNEALTCALIRALGELQYEPAEQELFRRYQYSSILERQALADALANINSGNPAVVSFLEEDYLKATSAVNKVGLLRVLYNYGERGRETFLRLKAQVPKEDLIYFEHVECKLIDSREYA